MPHLHEHQSFSHVLIVDDHPAQLATIHDIVLAEGFQPIPCTSPAQAFHALEQHKIGIAVVDLGLSDSDEAGFLLQLRTLNNGLRIIIYTGQGSLTTAKAAIVAGAFAYLEKGGNPNDLVHQLHRAMGDILKEHATKLEQTLKDSEKQKTILNMMVEGTASFTGKEFFQSLVKNLAQCLDVKYAIVTSWNKNTPGLSVAQTLAFWNGTNFGENFEIPLKDCPCGELLKGDPVFYSQGIPHDFPKLAIAKSLGIESYLGVPMTNPTGELIGHVAVFDTKPMSDDPSRWSIMKIFAARAAAELHNHQIQEQLSTLNETLKGRVQEGTAQLRERNAQLRLETFEHLETKEREASFGRILDHSFDEILIICANTFRFLRANHGALQNLGYTMEELRQMTPLDIKPEMTLASLTEFLRPLQNKETQKVQGTTVHRRKNGTLYPVEIHVQFASFGTTPAYCAVIIDITERRREELHKSEQDILLTLMLNTGPGCIKRVAGDGTLLSMNPAGLALIDACNEEEVLGLSVFELVVPEHRLAFKKMHQTVIEGTPQTLQFEIEGLKGTRRWMETYAAPFQNPITDQVEHLAVTHDIANRKMAEKASQRSEQAYRALYHNNPTMYFTVSREGIVQSVNQFGLDQLGYSQEDLVGYPVLNIFHPQDKVEVQKQFAQCLENPSQLAHWKFRKIKKNGDLIWVKETARIIQDSEGQSLALIVCEDITVQKQAEALIHDQKDALERLARGEGLQSILEHICRMIEAQSPGLRCSILLLENDTLWLGAAPSLPATFSQKINGIKIGPKAGSCGTAAFTKEPVIVSDIATDIATDPLWERGHRLALNHGIHACWSTPLISSKGQVLGTFAMYYDLPKSPDPHDLDLVKSASNLASIAIERKQNEQALQDTMERFDLAVKGSSDGLWEGVVLPNEPWYVPHTPVWWSPRFKELLGFQDHEFSNVLESWTTVLHPDDKDRIFAALYAHIEQRQPFDVEYRLLTKSDGYRWFSARGQGIWDDQGNLLRMAGSLRDITEKRNTEESLKRWASIFEHTQWGVAASAGTSPSLDLINPAYAQMHGYTVQELTGQPLTKVYAPEEHPKIPGFIQQVQERGHASVESTHIRKDGTTFPVLITVSAVKSHDTGEAYRIANVIDLTEQKQYEEALTEMNMALAHAMPGISQIDPSGCYLSANENYANLLGRKPSELLGQSWEHTVHPDDLPIAFQAYEETIHTGKGEFEARGIRKDGSMFYKHVLMVKADPLKNPGVSHHCFMRDITDRKEAENTLQVSEHSIRELYEITSSQDSTFDDKIRSLLQLGCQRFGLPFGMLTRRVGEQLQVEFLQAPENTWAEKMLVPICDSFCGMTLDRSEPLAFEDVRKTELARSSAYTVLGLEAYIGTKVLVGSQVFGSLCFVDQQPHSGKFTPSDIHFLQLMSRWIGGELERKQAEEALQEANERLRTLSQQLLTVQENERRQLARDLHDEIGQNLTAVKMNLHTLGQGKSVVQTHRIFQDSMQILDSMLKHVRELSLDLRPSLLDDLGLVAAVRWFVNRQAERAGWTAKIMIDDTMPPLPPDHATASFRVIQEALTNVMRHAQATHVTVQLRMKDHHLDLLIADNGIGFDSLQVQERSASGQTLGLLSMQERVRFLNGHLTITSQRNQGTQIRAHIPVTALVKDASAS